MSKLTFFSLGGLEEIGLNCYIYSRKINHVNSSIMIDLGIGFRDNKFPFLDTFIPDISFLNKPNNTLKAILFSHGHEDHIGALEYHYDLLKNIPIYATPFTADLIKNKLKYSKINDPNIIIAKFYKTYKIDEFNITFIPIEHSIPEASMILIESQGKFILHSGDFKINTNSFDPSSILKGLYNNVDYLFCDSTNADKDKLYESEKDILPDLNNIIQNAKGSIWVTLFSSNIERLGYLISIAKSNNKKVVLLGTSVNNYYNIACKHKYIIANNIITLEESIKYSYSEILYIITGSQGENNSFLMRVLLQEYKGLKININDTVVFLSKPIPGNELKVNKAYNLIISSGANLYKHGEYILHVSGHGYVKQIELLINTVKPRFVIPIHGELLQLNALSNISKTLGISSTIFKNGQIIDITHDHPKVIENIPFNKLYFEGGRNLSLEDNILKERKKALYDGVVFISLIVNKNIINKDVRLTTIGLLTSKEQERYLPSLINNILNLNKELSKQDITKHEIVKAKVKSCIKKFFKILLTKKPIIVVEVFYY